MTTVVATFRVQPPPGTAAELAVPLTFFDIIWLPFHPIRRLLFYKYACSKSEFLETLVPQLKESLSLTLRHYLPVAGNLLYPLDTEKKPVIRYIPGDSVSLTIAESSKDFDELVGNHARDADQFYDFVPQMPPVTDEPEYKLAPLIALQVTLFPGRGICIGFSNNHTLGDASSIVRFMLAWASINKFGGDEFLTKQSESLPNFDRSIIEYTRRTDDIFWNVMRQIPFKPSFPFPIPTSTVRATFILRQADLNKLKDLVLAKKPSLVQVSSFVVTASYAWSCLAKSGNVAGEEVEDNESELFFIPADARGRLNPLINPPVPANYFGNCLGGGIVDIEHKRLVGDDGFVTAAEAIAEEIKNRVNNRDEFLKDMEKWLSYMHKFKGKRSLRVSGSPKFDLTSADFGWGKAGKLEVVSLDGEKYSVSLCKSTVSEGGLEVGLSLPRARMDAFASIFADGIRS